MMKHSDNYIGLKQLDYSNFLELIKSNKFSKEELENNKEDDESIIEIKNEDYIKIVNDILQSIRNFLRNNKKNLDFFFRKFLIQNKNIELGKIIDILKSDFKIELNQIEIFCLFSKYKIDSDENSNEEIINYQNLKNDIENNLNNIIYKITNPINEIIGKNNNNFIDIFKQEIQKKKHSIERIFFFFFSKMKLKKINDNEYERLLDLETFKLMLKNYDIPFNNKSLNYFLLNKENIFENGSINIDNFIKLYQIDLKENVKNDDYDFDV